MQEPSYARPVSIMLALCIVLGGWLLIEYSNHPVLPHLPTELAPALREAPQQRPPVRLPSAIEAAMENNLRITFKCAVGGHVSYSDTPCARNERTISVTATEKEAPRDARADLALLQQKVASMEAARVERERTFAAANRSSGGSRSSPQIKEVQCQEIDKAIASIDSQLRQPHTGPQGDYLNAERRKLTDARFSIGC